jgi:prophage tail gpP-like protein
VEFRRLSALRAPVAALIEGESPLIEIQTAHDITKRFAEYSVIQETGGTEASAKIVDPAMAPAIRGRTVKALQQESTNLTQAALWARSRALIDSYTCNATVTGWTYADGRLWQPGDIITAYAPGAWIVREAPLIISQVTYQLDEQGGQQAQLSLSIPEAYSNEEPRRVPWIPE